jgi:hypothetical protein
MVRRNTVVSLHITNDLKNTTNLNLIICHCLVHQESLFTKIPTNDDVTVVSKLSCVW